MVAVLLLPAPAAAKELQYQGGSEPFGGNPPVGMTMEGNDAKSPKRLTGFAIDVVYECPTGTTDIQTESFPIASNAKAAVVRKNKKKDFKFFKWEYELKTTGQSGVLTPLSYQLVGVQSPKDPKVWIGEARVRKQEIGIEFGFCPLQDALPDGFVKWRAEFVGSG